MALSMASGVWGGGAWVNPPTSHCKVWCLGGGRGELACRLFHKTIFEYNGKSIQCIPLFLRFVLRLAFFSVAFSRNLLFTLAPRLRALHCFYPLSPVSCRNSPFFLLFNIVLSYMYIHTYMLAWARVSFICRCWLGWRWFAWPYFRFVVVHSRFYG